VPPTGDAPASRYGDSSTRPRPGAVAAVVVLAAAFVAWVVWAAIGAVDREPRAEVAAFDIASGTSIDVRVRLRSGDGPVVCTVRALDRTREVVGVADVRLGPDRADRWVTVRTRDPAVTATLERCTDR